MTTTPNNATTDIVMEKRCGFWVVRKGDEFFGVHSWGKEEYGYSQEQAELITEALIARKKVSARPKIKVVQRKKKKWHV